MNLTYHYAMENRGTETAVAHIAKAIDRGRYYRKLGETYGAEMASRLERIDAEVRRIKRICPYRIEKPAREFLAAGDDKELKDRMRLLREVAFGLKVRASPFVQYTFGVAGAIAEELMTLSRSLGMLKDGAISEYHAHIVFKSELLDAKMHVAEAFAGMSVPDLGSTGYFRQACTVDCKIERVSQLHIILSLDKP